MAAKVFRVFIVDDMQSRHDLIKQNFFHEVKAEIISAYSYDEACKILRNEDINFDYTFLDHDLCIEDILCDPHGTTHKPTGLTLAQWIVAYLFDQRALGQIYLHSQNPRGRRAMRAVLVAAGWNCTNRPFLELLEHGL